MSEPAAPRPDPPRPTHWWTSLPGLLTALAGLITAIAGLVTVMKSAPQAEPRAAPAVVQGGASAPVAGRPAAEVRDPDGHSNLRAGPGTDRAIIGRIDNGQRVDLIERSGSWWKVRSAQGLEGFLHASRLHVLPVSTP